MKNYCSILIGGFIEKFYKKHKIDNLVCDYAICNPIACNICDVGTL